MKSASFSALATALLASAVLVAGVGLSDDRPTSAASDSRTFELQVGGTPGIPANATAAALNLTVTDATKAGYITAYPCDENKPATSNLNYTPGLIVSNSAIVPLAANGKVCIYTHTTVNVIVDATAAFPASSSVQPVGPNRIMDTRPDGRTVNGGDSTRRLLRAGSTHQLQVGGTPGIPANATAAALNLTVTDATKAGYITAYPCDENKPATSNLNYTPGLIVSNSAIVPLAANGKVCIYTHTTVNVIVDATAAFPASSSVQPVGPNRIMDTRPDGRTVNGGDSTRRLLRAGSTHQLQVGGTPGIPANATAAALNLTVTDATKAGYITAYPCDENKPATSNLNYTPGLIVSNSAIVPLAANGKVCIYTHTTVNVIVDATAAFPAYSSLRTVSPNRLFDTRPTSPNPPTTTPPTTVPPRAQWSETFDGNTGLDRFRTGVHHRDDELVTERTWQGDHDLSCGAPETTRTIHRDTPSESFYTCRDHMMTALGDTSGYSIAWFSPKETFSDISEVCWSVNLTDLGSRKWWKVAVLSVDAPDVMSEVGAAELSGVEGPDRAIAAWGGVGAYLGKLRIGEDRMDWWYMTADQDKRTRYPACFRDNGNGTLTFTMTAPLNGGAVRTESFTTSGSFPAGEKKVVFQDHAYTPSKPDNGVGGRPIGYTFHWDNLSVS